MLAGCKGRSEEAAPLLQVRDHNGLASGVCANTQVCPVNKEQEASSRVTWKAKQVDFLIMKDEGTRGW